MLHHVMLINLCPLSRSMCLPIEQCSCDKFVDSELAREAENALTVSRPSLLCDMDIKNPPMGNITGKVHYCAC